MFLKTIVLLLPPPLKRNLISKQFNINQILKISMKEKYKLLRMSILQKSNWMKYCKNIINQQRSFQKKHKAKSFKQ